MTNIVQTKTALAAATSTTVPVTWSNNTTTGNFIVVCVQATNGTVQTVTGVADSQLNTYTLAKRSNTNADCEMWYAWNITGGTTPTITATLSAGSSGGAVILIREYSGVIKTADPLDQTALGSGTSGLPASAATPQTTYPYELLIGITASTNNQTFTPVAPYVNGATSSASFQAMNIEDRVVNTCSSYSSSFTGTSSTWDTCIATFKLITPSFRPTITRPRPFAPGIAR
jgi:hypothetical protein